MEFTKTHLRWFTSERLERSLMCSYEAKNHRPLSDYEKQKYKELDELLQKLYDTSLHIYHCTLDKSVRPIINGSKKFIKNRKEA